MPRVLYSPIGSEVPGAVFIGGPSRWGGPFLLGRDGNRGDVAAKYRHWLLSQPELVKAAVCELKGRDLVCGPDHWHGEVLLEVANQVSVFHGRLVDWNGFSEWARDGGYLQEELNWHDSRCLALVDMYLEEQGLVV